MAAGGAGGCCIGGVVRHGPPWTLARLTMNGGGEAWVLGAGGWVVRHGESKTPVRLTTNGSGWGGAGAEVGIPRGALE